MSKQNVANLFGLIVAVLVMSSCAAPNYLPAPTIHYPGIQNTCTFGVQNMDEKAKVDPQTLTAHYDGFDVNYKIHDDFVVSLVIINNSNKSLIIDKSKSYVLYDGYSTQLFKDVRSSRSTTFNNVQDAINNVQTNEAGVSMTVPPYSKWELPLQESNVRQIRTLPDFNPAIGIHSLTPFDNKETVEFIIPYSFDYSMAKWDTSRNRIFVNSIETKTLDFTRPFSPSGPEMFTPNQYRIIRTNGYPDFSEANRIDMLNRKKYKKHNAAVSASHWFWSTVTIFPLLVLEFIEDSEMGCTNHEPPTYGDRGRGVYNPSASSENNNPLVPFLGSSEHNNTAIENQGNISQLLGADFQEVTQQQKEQLGIKYGIKVFRITEGKMKAAGMPEGFIIQTINSDTINNIEDMENIIMKIKSTEEAVLYIRGIFSTGKRGYFVVEM